MWSSLLRKVKPAQEPAAPPAKKSGPPPLTAEETNGSLSILERKLNEQMKCPAGKNQVFIRSVITPSGTTPPRIALKCHLRKDIGHKPDVYFEHIRDICCCDPEQCDAYRKFKDRLVPT